MQRRLWLSLIGTVLIVTGAFAAILATGNQPVLGIDLQGGVSVILAPDEQATAEDLVVIRDLVRDELESFGVAEPEVRVQGSTIVVDLPGVKDQQEALDAVDVSGVVELRPVINFADCPLPPDQTDGATVTAPPQGVPGAELLPTRDGAVVCVGPAQGTGEVFARGARARSARTVGRCRSTCAATAAMPGTTWPTSASTRSRPAPRPSPACAASWRSCSTASCSPPPR